MERTIKKIKNKRSGNHRSMPHTCLNKRLRHIWAWKTRYAPIFFITLIVDDLSPISMHTTHTYKGGQQVTCNGR